MCALTVGGVFIAPWITVAGTPTWSGGGNANNSGSWQTGANWSSGTKPASDDWVTLPDVTSGTRTITSGSPETNIQLRIDQATPGAINQLNLNANLTIDQNNTPFVINASTGQSNVIINVGSGVALSSSFWGGTGAAHLGGTINLAANASLNIGANSLIGSTIDGPINVTGAGAIINWRSLWWAASEGTNTFNGPISVTGDGSVLTLYLNMNSGYEGLYETISFNGAGNSVSVGSGAIFQTVVGRTMLFNTPVNVATGALMYLGTNGFPSIYETVTPRFNGLTMAANSTNHISSGSIGSPSDPMVLGGNVYLAQGAALILDASYGSASIILSNSPTAVITQNAAQIQFYWSAPVNLGGHLYDRNFNNAGDWTLENGSELAFITTNGANNWGMIGSQNSGTIRLLSGSIMQLWNLVNSGTLILGTNVNMLTSIGAGAGDGNFINNTGAVTVNGTNALIGFTTDVNAGYTIFNNGTDSSQGATFTVTDGSECIIQGNQAYLNNYAGNTATVGRASTLSLLVNNNSINVWANLSALLVNNGVVFQGGTLKLNSQNQGQVGINNYGTYVVGQGSVATATVQRLLSGFTLYHDATIFNNVAGAILAGSGLLIYTNDNSTLDANFNTLTLNNAGTIAPGWPVGTLELANSAVTFANGTLAIQLYDATTFDKLKVSGTGAALNLTGGANVLNVSLVGRYHWDVTTTFRIFEGAPVTGTFATLQWNGAPVAGEYTVVYGSNYIDIVVPGANGTMIIVE